MKEEQNKTAYNLYVIFGKENQEMFGPQSSLPKLDSKLSIVTFQAHTTIKQRSMLRAHALPGPAQFLSLTTFKAMQLEIICGITAKQLMELQQAHGVLHSSSLNYWPLCSNNTTHSENKQ